MSASGGWGLARIGLGFSILPWIAFLGLVGYPLLPYSLGKAVGWLALIVIVVGAVLGFILSAAALRRPIERGLAGAGLLLSGLAALLYTLPLFMY